MWMHARLQMLVGKVSTHVSSIMPGATIKVVASAVVDNDFERWMVWRECNLIESGKCEV